MPNLTFRVALVLALIGAATAALAASPTLHRVRVAGNNNELVAP